jgi:hypothetical protein
VEKRVELRSLANSPELRDTVAMRARIVLWYAAAGRRRRLPR